MVNGPFSFGLPDLSGLIRLLDDFVVQPDHLRWSLVAQALQTLLVSGQLQTSVSRWLELWSSLDPDSTVWV